MGKNPWQSHGFPRARTTLKEIANDPSRAIIVIDPRRSETADLAATGGGFHLQVKPGTDAFCLSAMVAVIVQEGLVHAEWVRDHVAGWEAVVGEFASLPVAEYAARCGVDETLLRSAVRRLATAESVAVFEDLGVQMNRHSTVSPLVSRARPA